MIRSALDAVLLVLSYERLSLVPYDDGVGVLTIGWGHKILRGEPALGKGSITRERANELFMLDFSSHEDGVRLAVRDAPLTPLQLGALTSLTFNIGVGAFRGSSVARAINERRPADVPAAIRMWNKGRVKGVLQVMPGLAARRESEVRLWERGA